MAELAPRLTAALQDRYRIERELGAGGMATVYLAADLKHDRKVAIKVLKPELAAVLGAERFVQEIKTTAALSHPHILPLFDSGEVDGFLYYVMPFIEGETIREKLNRETQFGIEDAVRITTEVADALDYAHRHGVIHRDIKPENILLHDGRPMVMDFGIALAVSAAAGGRMTETGLSLGTPHYMSPEQATADKDITARSDIYSLASVLFEMLTGEPPHTGASAQQIIMKIIAEPVRPATALRQSIPPNVSAALAKALQKLPADRFESARAFADALTNAAFVGTGGAAVTDGGAADLAGARRWKQITASVVALALLVIATLLVTRPDQTAAPAMHVEIPVPEGITLVVQQGINFDVAPDGSAIVFVGADSSELQGLWLRRSERLDAVRLDGTANARNPRFSPDGKYVAFVAGDSLRTVSVAGAPPLTVVGDSVWGGTGGGGLAWGTDAYLYFPRANGDIARVAASGGTVERLLARDVAADSSTRYAWYDALPEGRGLIYSITSQTPAESRIAVLDLRSRESKVLLQGTVGRFGAPGELLYATSQGRILSIAFDADRLTIEGEPRPLMDGIQVNSGSATYLATSPSGALLYATGNQGFANVPTWINADGSETRMPMPRASGTSIDAPAVSPDGRRIAFRWLAGNAGSLVGDVWIYDVAQSTVAPLTTTGNATAPFWSPDGREIGYRVVEQGRRSTIYAQRADFSGGARILLPASAGALAAAWTPDGRALVYPDTSGRIQYAPLSRLGATTEVTGPILARDLALASMHFSISPDGRWVAFESALSGTPEVYVAPLPGPGGRQLVTSGGGSVPRWTRDGTSIIYQHPRTNVWQIASVRTAPDFAVTSRRRFAGGLDFFDAYDAAPGGRLAALRRGNAGVLGANQIRFVTDWRRALASGAPR